MPWWLSSRRMEATVAKRCGSRLRTATEPSECYRCWQVGNQATALYVVRYNSGTDHEWFGTSCYRCYLDDVRRFPFPKTVKVCVLEAQKYGNQTN
jgi:hypothetical protein